MKLALWHNSRVVNLAPVVVSATTGVFLSLLMYRKQLAIKGQSRYFPVFYGTVTGIVGTPFRWEMFVNTKKKAGRPKKDASETRGEYLDVRLGTAEKESFKIAADLAGLSMAAWVRERLRAAARSELYSAGVPVPFIRV